MPTRRRFLAGAAGFSVMASGLAAPAIAQAKPRVVIIGGGAGGASVLSTLTSSAPGALDITLVEPNETYTTCYYSNLYLGSVRTLESLQHGYDTVAARDGVTVAHTMAESVDRDARQVTLATGDVLDYDRLVVSPGISLDYDFLPGWGREAAEIMPHAWQAGPQTALLKKQLDAVPDGGVIVIVAPPNPYRCPPGPYERVSMMAHELKRTGRGNARIVILDPKDKFSKQALFSQGWERHYPGMIEWLSPMIHGGVKSVDTASMSVETDFETIEGAALVNVIPPQSAGRIAHQAGLTNETGFCPIDPFTLKAAGDDAVHVLGDASIAGDMPKSAFSANTQGSVVAYSIEADLLGKSEPQALFTNRCWSLIAPEDSVFVGASYKATEEKIASTESFISTLEDTPETRAQNYADSAGWYSGMTSDMYG